jgi:nucleoside-diphosphate-sugar epimerase
MTQGSITARLIASLPAGSTETVTLPVTPDLISATVHVDDLAFAYLAIINRRDDPAVRGQIFNIINPVGEKRKDILAAVSSITGFKGEFMSSFATVVLC